MAVPTIDYARPEPGNRSRFSLGFYVALGFGVLLVLSLVIPPGHPAGEKARQVKCASNLRQIGQACLLYANNNGGQYPPDLQTITQTQQIGMEAFVCPSTSDNKGTTSADLSKAGRCSYIYTGTDLTNNSNPASVVAFEDPDDHKLEGANLLFADGHVEFLNIDSVMTILNELNAGYNPPRPTQALPSIANARADYRKNWKPRMAQLKTGVWRIPATQPGL